MHGVLLCVLLGDVSTHGFSAALIMALVMAASGIHAESAETPTAVLGRLEESLTDELAETEMFLSLFYAVIDPARERLVYANAGHPHAFVVDGRTGAADRLGSTRPPLGLRATRGTARDGGWGRHHERHRSFAAGLVSTTTSRTVCLERRPLPPARRIRVPPAT